MGRPSDGIRKSPLTVTLPIDVLDRLDAMHARTKTPKVAIVEIALRKLFSEYDAVESDEDSEGKQ